MLLNMPLFIEVIGIKYFYNLFIKNDTTATTITAPNIDGTNAIPARLGPQYPNTD